MGNKINFVDQTIRDAQQSLWGNMMRTDMITPIAETMDQVGVPKHRYRRARRRLKYRFAILAKILGSVSASFRR